MLLLPPLSAPDTRPRYHISVSTNCFTPSSYITTVRKGGSEVGELVGEFECVILPHHVVSRMLIVVCAR